MVGCHSPLLEMSIPDGASVVAEVSDVEMQPIQLDSNHWMDFRLEYCIVAWNSSRTWSVRQCENIHSLTTAATRLM